MRWPCVQLILVYRVTLGRLLGGQCRFHPTCSQYAIDAINIHGVFKGIRMAARRILRCHPWGGSGYDPVPPSCCSCREAARTGENVLLKR